MNEHRNIAVFIPHIGCPHQCVFCNQNTISGCHTFEEKEVCSIIESALKTMPNNVKPEIAFFGGSFTGIDRNLMRRLLDTAQNYVNNGCVSSIRLSTRPDYISDEILSILSKYDVTNIELGLQSMDDAVLKITERGHTSNQAREACKKVVKAGFVLGGQMMIGLPGSTKESEVVTATEIVSLGAKEARIYPTVVFQQTKLAQMLREQKYTSLELQETIERSADCAEIFLQNQVKLLRIGLCANDALTDKENAIAGATQPAIGEMVYSELAYRELKQQMLANNLQGKKVNLYVPERKVSIVVGQHRCNFERLKRDIGTTIIKTIKTQEDSIKAIEFA